MGAVISARQKSTKIKSFTLKNEPRSIKDSLNLEHLDDSELENDGHNIVADEEVEEKNIADNFEQINAVNVQDEDEEEQDVASGETCHPRRPLQVDSSPYLEPLTSVHSPLCLTGSPRSSEDQILKKLREENVIGPPRSNFKRSNEIMDKLHAEGILTSTCTAQDDSNTGSNASLTYQRRRPHNLPKLNNKNNKYSTVKNSLNDKEEKPASCSAGTDEQT